MSTDRPSYRAVLRTPRILRSFLPSILGRLSLATSGLALVLLLEQSTGSFAVAGAVTGVLGIANVLATPWRARIIDRRGQTIPLSVLSAAHAITLIAFGLFPNAPLSLLLVIGIAAGASSPPFGATMRVLWSEALPAGPLRARGFSLDAIAEEVTFAIGPLAAALLAALFDPLASLMLSAGAVAAGTLLFVMSPLSCSQHGSARDASVHRAPAAVTPMRARGFPVIVGAIVAPGIVLGAIEIAAPAIAAAAGSTPLSGALLALFAGGSAVGGLVYGRIRWRWRLERQLLVLIAVSLAVAAVTGVIGGVAAAVIGFTICGSLLAPVMIVGYLSADARTDAHVRTEASSWINTAVNFGAAIGAVVFGALTDVAGPEPALAWTALTAGLIAIACAPPLIRARR